VIRVGFVGLGSQGGPMAQRIVDAGYPMTVWARRPATVEAFVAAGARQAASLTELGAASDVLCVCVVDDAGVDEVLRGPDGAMAAMTPGSVVVVHSTVHPGTCTRLADDHPHLHVIDAPVSGGGLKAAARELLVMVGGDPVIVERCRPVFETYGSPVVHLGHLGAGLETKLLNNALFAAQLGLAAEVYARALTRGLDQVAVAAALSVGSCRSYAAELVAGMGFGLGNLAGATAALLAKDVGIVAELDTATQSPLLDAADAALALMGVVRAPGKDSR
jgi:3-hydroxyisobutyrate dehydrogenase